MSATQQRPQRIAVLGAGLVGLSTAWYLQEYGADVTVLDREGVAAGSSWGNAGWLTPSMAVPLPEPSVLTYGLRAVLQPSSPVYVPPTADPRLIRFLLQFARNCTPSRWQQAMKSLIPLNNGALAAFAEMEAGGVTARTLPAEPFTAAFPHGRGQPRTARGVRAHRHLRPIRELRGGRRGDRARGRAGTLRGDHHRRPDHR